MANGLIMQPYLASCLLLQKEETMTDNNDDDGFSDHMRAALEAVGNMDSDEDERSPSMRIMDACALITASIHNIKMALKEIH